MAQPMRIFCREDINLNVVIRGTTVVLARANPDDELQHWVQHWVQDFSAAGTVTDDEGQRAFALVNKATGQALANKNIISPSDKQVHVQLAPYIPDVRVDLSMLWTLGADLGGGFREVRVLRDITQTLNGLWGNVRDGTVVGVHPARLPAAPNAVWKFAPVYQHQQ